MKVTSALANKKIKMLEEQKTRILELEASSCVYIRADGEVESPPAYDYAKTQQEVTEINNKIRKKNMRLIFLIQRLYQYK